MIVDSTIDLSEGGRRADRPEQALVLIYHVDDYSDLPKIHDEALAAIGRCRLLREGHGYNTEIHHSLSTWLLLDRYEWRLDEHGEVVPRGVIVGGREVFRGLGGNA